MNIKFAAILLILFCRQDGCLAWPSFDASCAHEANFYKNFKNNPNNFDLIASDVFVRADACYAAIKSLYEKNILLVIAVFFEIHTKMLF